MLYAWYVLRYAHAFLYISGCRKIHGVARGKGFAHVLMVSSIAPDQVYRTYSACGKAYGATHKRHDQFSHFHRACREEVRRCPYASMWGSKWGNCSQIVPSNCVLNHMLIPWVSEVIYYCDYLHFSNILLYFMCSTGRLTVKCLEICELWYAAYMLAYASVLHLTICGITWSPCRGTRGLTKLGPKFVS